MVRGRVGVAEVVGVHGAGSGGWPEELGGTSEQGEDARSPPSSRAKGMEGMDLLVAAGGDAVVWFCWERTDGVGSCGPRVRFAGPVGTTRRKPGPSRKSPKVTAHDSLP